MQLALESRFRGPLERRAKTNARSCAREVVLILEAVLAAPPTWDIVMVGDEAPKAATDNSRKNMRFVVPVELAHRLDERAKLNHRSRNGEFAFLMGVVLASVPTGKILMVDPATRAREVVEAVMPQPPSGTLLGELATPQRDKEIAKYTKALQKFYEDKLRKAEKQAQQEQKRLQDDRIVWEKALEKRYAAQAKELEKQIEERIRAETKAKLEEERAKLPPVQVPDELKRRRYLGVSKYGTSGKWQARVTVAGGQVRLGEFDSPELAALAYDEHQRKAGAPLERLNFPSVEEFEKVRDEHLFAEARYNLTESRIDPEKRDSDGVQRALLHEYAKLRYRSERHEDKRFVPPEYIERFCPKEPERVIEVLDLPEFYTPDFDSLAHTRQYKIFYDDFNLRVVRPGDPEPVAPADESEDHPATREADHPATREAGTSRVGVKPVDVKPVDVKPVAPVVVVPVEVAPPGEWGRAVLAPLEIIEEPPRDPEEVRREMVKIVSLITSDAPEDVARLATLRQEAEAERERVREAEAEDHRLRMIGYYGSEEKAEQAMAEEERFAEEVRARVAQARYQRRGKA